MVITPSPPIWMRTRITACPKILQDETVGVTTKPVTQVEVVAVKSESKNGVGFPLAELIGRERSSVPISIAAKKLNNIICVVDIGILFFFILYQTSQSVIIISVLIVAPFMLVFNDDIKFKSQCIYSNYFASTKSHSSLSFERLKKRSLTFPMASTLMSDAVGV